MLKCVIVDDEFKSGESLKKMLLIFFKEVKVCATCQSVAEGLVAIADFEPDVVFLDVLMQGETGFDLISSLEEVNFEIIFTTAHSEYALQAIKFSAIDYLLKPIHLEDLKSALDKAEGRKNNYGRERLELLRQHLALGKPENAKIALPTAEGLTFIKVSDILYCKASGSYTEIFIKSGKKYLVSRQLHEYEDLLKDYHFFRIHHSTLIQMDYLEKYIRGDGG